MKARKIDKVLVTGGAGFIGSHTVDLLVDRGYDVIALDNLEPQVHGSSPILPGYLNVKAKMIVKDFRDKNTLNTLLRESDAVIHLAALVGVGQSMYEPSRYVGTNTHGTADLLERLITVDHNVKKLVVASSMSIYGEGKYRCDRCQKRVHPGVRDEKALKAKKWEHICPDCGSALSPQPTDEDTDPKPTSVYAMSKRHQEEMSLIIGKTYGLPTIALRYFNVYGSRQSLGNPYTGACAIFSSRFLSGNPPYIFEDGRQLRDFVHVRDVALANLLALENNGADYQAVNIGTGEPTSLLHLVEALGRTYERNIRPFVSLEYRKGDIRHCYADIGRAKKLLGFESHISLDEGLIELAKWAKLKDWGKIDFFDKALRELRERGLTGK